MRYSLCEFLEYLHCQFQNCILFNLEQTYIIKFANMYGSQG